MSLGGTGLRDWLVQRFTAILLAGYTLFMFAFLVRHPQLTFDEWSALFSNPVMKISTLMVFISMAFHAWIGLWIVLTDYVKVVFIRYLLQGIILLTLFGYGVWGILILWGV